MSKIVFSLLLMSAFFGPPVLAVAAVPQTTGGPRLVLHPPWMDGAVLVRAAGGAPVGPYRAAMGTLAASPQGVAFDRRLRASGAWGVFDGTALARLCGIEPISF